MTFTCGTCLREFPAGWQSRAQHMQATGHRPPSFECQTCDRYFQSKWAMRQHMNALNHWTSPQYPYVDCTAAFSSTEQLRSHQVDVHIYCGPCDQHFQNHNNIKMHLNGKAHRPANLACPFCDRLHTTATGLIHHLERGSCPNAPLDRTKLYNAVRLRDPNGVLTKKLLTWSTSTAYEATGMAYNAESNAFECYFCHHHFKSLNSLNQHLSSPVHQQDLYHCPNRGCSRDFTTLAAVINHLESETCGFMRFSDVQTTTKRIIDPRRMISF